jgi:CRISPR-associated protein Cas5t
MKTLLEVRFRGWTATPRLPFILSGNAVCMPTPSYSLLLGLVGCCLGRLVEPEEVRLGFKYSFDDNAFDIETRHRLINDGSKIKAHGKGTDAYKREFHVNPKLTLWIDRLDWEDYFRYPIGAPALGRSQDLLKIEAKHIRTVEVEPVQSAKIDGSMLPFDANLTSSGQLVQLAEAFRENDVAGGGRSSTVSSIFLSIPWMDAQEKQSVKPITFPNLYQTPEKEVFYLHDWQR